MVNKDEISPKEKLSIVRKINRGDLGPSEAARKLGVHVTTVRRWQNKKEFHLLYFLIKISKSARTEINLNIKGRAIQLDARHLP